MRSRLIVNFQFFFFFFFFFFTLFLLWLRCMDVYIVTFFKSTYLRTEGSSAFDLKVPKIYLVLPRCAVLGSITNGTPGSSWYLQRSSVEPEVVIV